MKILIATEKPFSKEAVNGIKEIVEKNGHELALLENIQIKKSCLMLCKQPML